MADVKDKDGDFYAVLGLNKECSPAELRNAYKKLALRWHPDRCSASGNAKFVEESKKRFQAIQEAYSVLSDSNKRFLYDVGVYDSDDEDDGMGDFLGEMAFMMSQSKPNGNVQESFEDLQDLFQEMFQRDTKVFGSSSKSDERNFSEMNVEREGHSDFSSFQADSRAFCLGVRSQWENGAPNNSSSPTHLLGMLTMFGQLSLEHRFRFGLNGKMEHLRRHLHRPPLGCAGTVYLAAVLSNAVASSNWEKTIFFV